MTNDTIDCARLRRLVILDDVSAERDIQDRKFGTGQLVRDTDYWLPILVEEVGEVARAVCDGNIDNYREELVQVAAVAVAMLEAWVISYGKRVGLGHGDEKTD